MDSKSSKNSRGSRDRCKVRVYDGQWCNIRSRLYWSLYNLDRRLEEYTIPELAEMFGSTPARVQVCLVVYDDYLRYRPRSGAALVTRRRAEQVREALRREPMRATTLAKAIGLKTTLMYGVLDSMDDISYDDDSSMYFLVDMYEEQKDYMAAHPYKERRGGKSKL